MNSIFIKPPSTHDALRVYSCAHCKCVVLICSCCDRGHHFCKTCSSSILLKLQKNNQRQSYHYHNSPNARVLKRIRNQAYYQANKEKIKARQQARRAQKRNLSQNMTCSANACSEPIPCDDLISTALEPVFDAVNAQKENCGELHPLKTSLTCHFCRVTTAKYIRFNHLYTSVK